MMSYHPVYTNEMRFSSPLYGGDMMTSKVAPVQLNAEAVSVPISIPCKSLSPNEKEQVVQPELQSLSHAESRLQSKIHEQPGQQCYKKQKDHRGTKKEDFLKLRVEVKNTYPRVSKNRYQMPMSAPSCLQNAKDKKRRRRMASEIERKYQCPYASCKRAYGTETSLNQHVRLKHRKECDNRHSNSSFYFFMDALLYLNNARITVPTQSPSFSMPQAQVRVPHEGIPIPNFAANGFNAETSMVIGSNDAISKSVPTIVTMTTQSYQPFEKPNNGCTHYIPPSIISSGGEEFRQNVSNVSKTYSKTPKTRRKSRPRSRSMTCEIPKRKLFNNSPLSSTFDVNDIGRNGGSMETIKTKGLIENPLKCKDFNDSLGRKPADATAEFSSCPNELIAGVTPNTPFNQDFEKLIEAKSGLCISNDIALDSKNQIGYTSENTDSERQSDVKTTLENISSDETERFLEDLADEWWSPDEGETLVDGGDIVLPDDFVRSLIELDQNDMSTNLLTTRFKSSFTMKDDQIPSKEWKESTDKDVVDNFSDDFNSFARSSVRGLDCHKTHIFEL